MKVENLFSFLNKQVSNLTVAGTVVAVGGSLIALRLADNFFWHQIVLMCGGTLVGTGAAGYALYKVGSGQMGQLLDRLRRQGAVVETAGTGNEWLDMLENDYRAGSKKVSIPIGQKDDGSWATVEMVDMDCHLLTTASSGMGKSVLINQLLIPAARTGNYQVVIVSLSNKDYTLLEPMRNVHIFSYAENVEDPLEAISAFARSLFETLPAFKAEVVRRQRFLSEHGLRSMEDAPANIRLPKILFVVEEFTNALLQIEDDENLGSDGRKRLVREIRQIIQFGRSSGCHLMLIGQRATGSISNNIKMQMVPITLRASSASEAYLATGRPQTGAENLKVFNRRTKERGELFSASSRGMGKYLVAFTPDEILEEAVELSAGAPFAGDPTWMPSVARVLEASDRTMRRMESYRTKERENPQMPTSSQTAAAPAPTAVAAAPAPALSKLPLPPIVLDSFVKRLLAEADDFANRTPAYNDLRTRQIFSLSLAGFSQNETLDAVFGNRKGAYRDYYNLCQSHLENLRRLWNSQTAVRQRRIMAKLKND